MPTDLGFILQITIYPLLAGLVGLLVERFALPGLEKFTKKSRSHLDNAVISSLKNLIAFWFALATFLSLIELHRDTLLYSSKLTKLCLALLVVSVSLFITRVMGVLVKSRTKDVSGKLPATSIILNIVRVGVILITGTIVLQLFSISVTPLLTALGVGGLAVALALQETLSNLFSGIQLIASKNVRKGDYVMLSTGEKGYIHDITWRNTVIRELANNLIIVPNSKLSSAIITNYALPESELAILVEAGVSYSNDLELVEHLTVQTAKIVLENTNGSITGFEAFIRYHTFGESGIFFTVILRGTEFESQYLIKHEFIKALHKTFKDHNIELPFAHRTISIKQTSASTPNQSDT